MSDRKRLVHAILNFLATESEADVDSLSVASQVISDSYNINPNDSSLALPAPYSLLDVFTAGVKALNIQTQQQAPSSSTTTDNLEVNPKYQAFIKQLEDMGYFNNCDDETRKQRTEKAKEKFLSRTQTATTTASSSATAVKDTATAEKHKNEGNELLKKKQFKEAIESYKNAIKFDPTNAIYPANMGAAYLQINDLDNAEQCCKKAIELDSKYSKAYSRLALIYQRKGRTQDAISQLELASKNDPTNEEYKNKLAELRQIDSRPANPFAGLGGMGGLGNLANMMGGLGGGGGAGGMPDLGGLGQMMNNPEFMRMAMDMMQRPEMQNLVQNMMGNFLSGNDSDSASGENVGMEGLDAAGIEKVLQEPEVQNNPKLKQIFEECREKGINHALNYINDPEVAGFMRDFAMRQLNNLPADQNPFSQMGGNPFAGLFNQSNNNNNNNDDDDNNNNMYS